MLTRIYLSPRHFSKLLQQRRPMHFLECFIRIAEWVVKANGIKLDICFPHKLFDLSSIVSAMIVTAV